MQKRHGCKECGKAINLEMTFCSACLVIEQAIEKARQEQRTTPRLTRKQRIRMERGQRLLNGELTLRQRILKEQFGK